MEVGGPRGLRKWLFAHQLELFQMSNNWSSHGTSSRFSFPTLQDAQMVSTPSLLMAMVCPLSGLSSLIHTLGKGAHSSLALVPVPGTEQCIQMCPQAPAQSHAPPCVHRNLPSGC